MTRQNFEDWYYNVNTDFVQVFGVLSELFAKYLSDSNKLAMKVNVQKNVENSPWNQPTICQPKLEGFDKKMCF